MEKKGKNIVSLEDRIPKLKQQRRKKANRRLIFLLLLFFILIAFILYFQSPLSHVRNITIIGNNAYTEDEIISISNITKDTNIWKVKEEIIETNINKLPEIKASTVSIQLPNSVEIKIQEYKRIAYLSEGKSYMPVLENGKILNGKQTSNLPLNAPILFNFKENEVLKEMIIGLEQLPVEVINSISEIHSDPKDSDLYHISLYMNDGNEVSATIRTFADKMTHYPSIISQLGPDQRGVINLEVGTFFKAYDSEGADLDEVDEEEVEG